MPKLPKLSTYRPKTHSDDRAFNEGRPPGDSEPTYAHPPTDEQLLPPTIIIRVAGSVTLYDWDQEARVLKDELVDLFRRLSNRPLENGLLNGEQLILEEKDLLTSDGRPSSAYTRRHGIERCTIEDAFRVVRSNQGSTARELTQKLFRNAPAPAALEPRVRSLLHRLKLKAWVEARYDDSGVQRWYAIDVDGAPDTWDARARAIAYTLVDLWGGKPRDYTRQVDAITALMDKQGDRINDSKAWIVERERPF